MTKKDIVEIVTDQMKRAGNPIKKKHIHLIVECVFAVFIDQLTESGRIEIRNFGIFKIKKTPDRIGRNPLTGEKAEIPARNIIQFKAGNRMKQTVGEKS